MNKLPIFTLYWGSHDEEHTTLLHHPDKTPEDFDRDVKESAKQLCLEFVQGEGTNDHLIHGGCDLFDAVEAHLISQLGYERTRLPGSELPDHGFIFSQRYNDPEYSGHVGWREYLGSDLFDQLADKAKKFYGRRR